MNKAVKTYLKNNKDAREFHCSVCGKLIGLPMVGTHMILPCDICNTINEIIVVGDSYTVKVSNQKWKGVAI